MAHLYTVCHWRAAAVEPPVCAGAPSSNIANPSKYHITRRIIWAIVRIQSKNTM